MARFDVPFSIKLEPAISGLQCSSDDQWFRVFNDLNHSTLPRTDSAWFDTLTMSGSEFTRILSLSKDFFLTARASRLVPMLEPLARFEHIDPMKRVRVRS